MGTIAFWGTLVPQILKVDHTFNGFKTMNYGQTEFNILPKLVRNQYKKHIGSIYVDQVKVTGTNIIIFIDQFYSPVFKRVRSYMNGAQT